MTINIEMKNSVISLICNTEEIFEYDLDNEINLTSLVTLISDSCESICVVPESYEEFATLQEPGSETLYKVCEYIYKTIDAFNESYFEVYPEL